MGHVKEPELLPAVPITIELKPELAVCDDAGEHRAEAAAAAARATISEDIT